MRPSATPRHCVRCGARLASDNTGIACSPCQRTAREAGERPPQVPREFWDHPQLRDALIRERHIGRAVRSYREHPFHGQKPISQSLAAKWLNISQTQLSRIESGRSLHDLDRLIQWAKTLRIPPELLWFSLPDEKPISTPATKEPSESESIIISADREVSDPPAGDSGIEDIARLIAWINGTNTTSDAIEQIERAALYLSGVHSKISPQIVLSGVLETHGQVQTYLQSGKQRLRQTRELLRIDSGLLSHACLLLGDLGHNQKASEYGSAALVLAQEADADQASAWSARAKTARWQERYVESAELARRGFEAAALSPIKVELAYREANAIALFGDARRARRALHNAQAAAETLPHDPGSSVWSFPAARQAIFAQSVAIQTGDPDGALHAAEMAEAAWANGEPKIPATCAQIQTGASIAHLMKDSLDGASCSITPVLNLPYELRISTVIGYVRKLRSMLDHSRFAGSFSAVDLVEKLDDFICAAPLGKD